MEFNYKNFIKVKNKRIKKILDIYDRKDKEIERLKGIIEEQERLYQEVLDNNEEIKIKNRRLNNIINKAIEYIDNSDILDIHHKIDTIY